ncbi:YbaB/EbfC family nucleoid-associated protein [Saccharopolyspora cebuensis]|uniref:YbaB/EbfC family nucleoid-associated protein n=1 Tax=Saccharopolyspora cebuensis TaxID=418759 RepID=A0ABV4CG25_9PSEU
MKTDLGQLMEDLTGTARSDDGLVTAELDAEGRLQRLSLDPELLRRGRNGPVLDTTTLADRITAVVNAAYDDLVQKLSARNSEQLAAFTNELQAATSAVERSLDDLGTNLQRSMRELGSNPPPMPDLRERPQ